MWAEVRGALWSSMETLTFRAVCGILKHTIRIFLSHCIPFFDAPHTPQAPGESDRAVRPKGLRISMRGSRRRWSTPTTSPLHCFLPARSHAARCTTIGTRHDPSILVDPVRSFPGEGELCPGELPRLSGQRVPGTEPDRDR